jgi:uncharacterized membrane protein YgdD (TMEM256/DUF423 family)
MSLWIVSQHPNHAMNAGRQPTNWPRLPAPDTVPAGESSMQRLWMGFGALAGLLAVAMAAATTHALTDEAALRVAASAVQMQGWHALALLATGLWAPRGGILAHLAGVAFALGLLAFCGALYALAFSGLHAGPLAPVGGTMLMAGWLLLGLSAIRPRA